MYNLGTDGPVFGEQQLFQVAAIAVFHENIEVFGCFNGSSHFYAVSTLN